MRTIPTDNEHYALLSRITDNQWVIMDKDYNFYIHGGNVTLYTYTLQSTKDSNNPLPMLRNAVFIKPLPQETSEIKSSEKDNISSTKTKNQINQEPKTSIEDTKKAITSEILDKQKIKKLTPHSGNTTNHTYIIGRLTFIAFLGDYFYNSYDKFTSLMTLFNNIPHRSSL